MKVKFTDIDVKSVESDLKKIDDNFSKLQISVDRSLQNELEYNIYNLRNKVSDIKRIYIRNDYIREQEKSSLFKQKREWEKSDLSTTKSINKEYAEENNYMNLQKMIVEWLEDKQDNIIRLANHINNMRIADLADAKRQDFTNK